MWRWMSLGARLIIDFSHEPLLVLLRYTPTAFHPSLSLPSFPDSFRSPFATLSLTHSNCREMIRCHSCQVRYEHSGLFSLLSGIVLASTSSIFTHHPTAPHLFLPLTTLEDILMITISNKGQGMQRERIETEKKKKKKRMPTCRRLVNCWFSIL